MNKWHILLLFKQIEIIICKIPDLGGQFVCSFKSNLKVFESQNIPSCVFVDTMFKSKRVKNRRSSVPLDNTTQQFLTHNS